MLSTKEADGLGEPVCLGKYAWASMPGQVYLHHWSCPEHWSSKTPHYDAVSVWNMSYHHDL